MNHEKTVTEILDKYYLEHHDPKVFKEDLVKALENAYEHGRVSIIVEYNVKPRSQE
jgi:hypothetical protein